MNKNAVARPMVVPAIHVLATRALVTDVLVIHALAILVPVLNVTVTQIMATLVRAINERQF